MKQYQIDYNNGNYIIFESSLPEFEIYEIVNTAKKDENSPSEALLLSLKEKDKNFKFIMDTYDCIKIKI